MIKKKEKQGQHFFKKPQRIPKKERQNRVKRTKKQKTKQSMKAVSTTVPVSHLFGDHQQKHV